MKYILKITSLLVILLTSCGSDKSGIEIGKYYKVSEGLTVQFPGTPEPSAGGENEFVSSKEFRYSFPDERNDGNALYSIAIYRIKNDTLFENLDKRVDYVVGLNNLAIETFLKGNVDKTEKIEFNGKYAVRHKARIFAPFLNDKIFVNSIFFNHKEFVIRAFVYTTKDKENNPNIDAFFDNIKIN